MKHLTTAVWAAVLSAALCAGTGVARAQSSACPAEPASLKPTAPDIFNDQQEQWLGEALAELTERGMVFAPPQENAYLQALGERILAKLPPTAMHFQFRVYESAELNAFSMAGGRVYVSRKLVYALTSEDELAGVLAHEMGHILAHQSAIEFTAILSEQLGVKQVGDRADVFDKIHQLLEGEGKRSHLRLPSEERNDDVADQVAIYAMAQNGYQPQAYARAFDRITANKGKMGNGLADFFGMTNVLNRRYRADVKMAQLVPERCMAPAPPDKTAFFAWQKLLLEHTAKPRDTNAASSVLALKDPLRSDLNTIRYSPDGKYVLAQDYANIFVIQRSPLKLLFTIDAESTMLPHFTPDSRELVFLTEGLRVERWDLATQKRTLIKEMVMPEGCNWQELSPDGHVIACERIYSDKNGWPTMNLALWSVDSNEIIVEKPRFKSAGTVPDAQELYTASNQGTEPGSFEFSPNSRWFIAGVQGAEMVYDLDSEHKASAEHGISSLRGRDFIFLGNDRVAALSQPESQIYSFPDGKLLKSLTMGWQHIAGVTQGNYALLRPIKDNAVGLEDLDSGKLIAASKYGAMDVFNDEVATQTPQGGVQINPLKPGKPEERVDLPVSRIGVMLDADFTPDGKYLVLSTPHRSAVWSVTTGTRLGEMRPFQDAANLPGDTVYLDFTKMGDKPRTQRIADLPHGAMPEAKVKLPEKASLAGGGVYMLRKSADDKQWWRNASLEFYDLITGNLAWSRHFAKSTPSVVGGAEGDPRLCLWWAMSIPSDREEIESEPELKQALAEVGNQRDGIVVQMVDAHTGKVEETLAVKEHKPKKARDLRFLQVVGAYLLVRGEVDNTVIYRMSDGARIAEVFGLAIAGDSSNGLLAFYNRRNEVFLVDAATGKELARYSLASDIRLARFVPAEKKLLVLTAEEKVYTFNVGGVQMASATPK
jgi:WD40 repeat protein